MSNVKKFFDWCSVEIDGTRQLPSTVDAVAVSVVFMQKADEKIQEIKNSRNRLHASKTKWKERALNLSGRIQELEKQLADYRDCQNKNSIESDRLYDDNASLRKQLDSKTKHLERNEDYFSCICEALEIDHKSKLSEILIAISESVPKSEIEEILTKLNQGLEYAVNDIRQPSQALSAWEDAIELIEQLLTPPAKEDS